MKANSMQDELAKLKEHEFYLDLEELDRLHREADQKIQKVCVSKKFTLYCYDLLGKGKNFF
jgi:hypothetical protein